MKDLTLWENEVKEIELLSYDSDSAHHSEDRMMWTFIEEIKDGKIDNIEHAQKVASIIYRSKGLKFTRWCS